MKFGAFLSAFLAVAATFSYLAGGALTALLCVISTVCLIVTFGALVGLYCHEFKVIENLDNKSVIFRGLIAIVVLAIGTALMRYDHDIAATIIMIAVWLILVIEKQS